MSDSETENVPVAAPPAAAPTLWEVIRSATEKEIQERIAADINDLVRQFSPDLDRYCLLSLYDPTERISPWNTDRIFSALRAENPKRDRDVYLFLVSTGGRIEPAYQISKVCKLFSASKFAVAIPRSAKSAATLIALGADEIHMGILGEMGPIDPQLGNLPALGVKRALETIAGVCEKYPKSSEAMARYMSLALTVEQIGYCERAGESAVQYAERLLAKKFALSATASKMANELVYEYKDHGFVIDLEEARAHLGDSWILTDTPEERFAEKVYELLNMANLLLGIVRNKRLMVVGSLTSGKIMLFDLTA
jgi:membrane-bound ClpP family serine protease